MAKSTHIISVECFYCSAKHSSRDSSFVSSYLYYYYYYLLLDYMRTTTAWQADSAHMIRTKLKHKLTYTHIEIYNIHTHTPPTTHPTCNQLSGREHISTSSNHTKQPLLVSQESRCAKTKVLQCRLYYYICCRSDRESALDESAWIVSCGLHECWEI